MPPRYSIGQYFYDYDKKLKDINFASDKAYLHYMKICESKHRRFDNDRENFTIEYEDRYFWSKEYREFALE